MRDLGALNTKWDIYKKKFLSSSLGIYIKEEEERLKESDVVNDSKETMSSRHNGANIHMKPQRVLQHIQDLHKFKPDKIPA